ncbi:alpha/beta hydrolase family protein [Nocardia sp. alder85J]|uniref:alpha/beta hydrolase family protein n=1 Tax=Nocardia sp. alder85J TaxID=2862949 RepID=UPI001CD38F96|nr:alpha/beta fold hydrolase [Nocardia sp. alder85J]MCX4095166.1 alpha/beta fold hydrolase [Nocardia sp. alder85J]
MGALRSLTLMLLVTMVAACAQSGSGGHVAPPGLDGAWNGVLVLPNQQLPVGITFADGGGTLDVPVQGAYGLPLDEVRADAGAVSFRVPQLPGDVAFRGSYDRGADSIVGTFVQGGRELPLTLRRGEVPVPPRPQEPRPPWPYRAEDVTFRSGDITVAGTVTVPDTPGRHPAVVLIAGSGPQDRNEQIFGHKPFLLLADTLTRAGYAVLRTDKRGIGGTGGTLNSADYRDLTDDAAAGVAFMRGRADVDAGRIGLLGHSEGGYLAPLVAARPDSGVSFVILMAGPAVVGADVLLEQNRLIAEAAGAAPEQIRGQLEFVSTLVTLLRAGDLDRARDLYREHNATLAPEQRRPAAEADYYTSTNFRSFLNYDPAPALSALRVPVLAFFGSKDLQVPPEQSESPMRKYLAADTDADVHLFDGLNHLMQPTSTGTIREYGTIETTIDPAVLDYVTGWLTARVPPLPWAGR